MHAQLHHPTTQEFTAPLPDVRSARIWDAPFMFELILEGSLAGSFSGDYLSGTGHVKLLRTVLRGSLAARSNPDRWLVAEVDGIPIGLAVLSKLSHDPGAGAPPLPPSLGHDSDSPVTLIRSFAVAPAHRRAGHGAALLAWIKHDAAQGTVLVAHCTKYARAMQRALKRAGFSRDPSCHEGTVSRYLFLKR